MKKTRAINYSMVNTTYNSTQDMIKKIESSKRKNLKLYLNISKYYDEKYNGRQIDNFQFEEDPFSKNVEGIGKIYHEVLLLLKFLQTISQVKSMIINYYDLYYTVIKNRDDKNL